MQGDQFALVSLEGRMDLTHLYVPQLGGAVHRPSRNQQSVGVEGYGNDFACVAGVRAD